MRYAKWIRFKQKPRGRKDQCNSVIVWWLMKSSLALAQFPASVLRTCFFFLFCFVVFPQNCLQNQKSGSFSPSSLFFSLLFVCRVLTRHPNGRRPQTRTPRPSRECAMEAIVGFASRAIVGPFVFLCHQEGHLSALEKQMAFFSEMIQHHKYCK